MYLTSKYSNAEIVRTRDPQVLIKQTLILFWWFDAVDTVKIEALGARRGGIWELEGGVVLVFQTQFLFCFIDTKVIETWGCKVGRVDNLKIRFC